MSYVFRRGNLKLWLLEASNLSRVMQGSVCNQSIFFETIESMSRKFYALNFRLTFDFVYVTG